MKTLRTLLSIGLIACIAIGASAQVEKEQLAIDVEEPESSASAKVYLDEIIPALQKGQYRKFLSRADHALALCEPDDSATISLAYYMKSQACLGINDFDSWLASINAAVKFDGDYQPDRGLGYGLFGKYAESEADLAEYAEYWALSEAQTLQLARNLMQRGAYEEAIDIMENLWCVGNAEACRLAFECSMTLEKYDDAAYFGAFASRGSWGEILDYPQEKWLKVDESAAKVFDHADDVAFARYRLAVMRGDCEAALSNVGKIDMSDPDNKPGRSLKAECYMLFENHDKSIEEYEKYRDLIGGEEWRDDTKAQRNLALQYYFRGDYEKALDIFFEMQGNLQFDIAHCYMGLHQWDYAIAMLEAAVAADENAYDSEMRVFLADCHRMAGNQQRAEELYRELIDSDEFRELGFPVIMALASVGERDEALGLLPSAIDGEYVRKGSAQLYAGTVCLRVGDKDAALGYLEEALAAGFPNPGTVLSLADYAAISSDPGFQSIMKKYFPNNKYVQQ